MKREFKPSKLPFYGCLSGVELLSEKVDVLPGIKLWQVYVDTIGTNMLAFGPPPTPKSPHPSPWIAVRGESNFHGRVDLEITSEDGCMGLTPTVSAWLMASMLRLTVKSPVRLALIGNMPFRSMASEQNDAVAVMFENAPQQLGVFETECEKLTEEHLYWLRGAYTIATKLYHNERFFRSLSIYDQAQWSATKETSVLLIWTSLEILLGISSEREKTKQICRSLSEYVAADREDRDRAYQVIQKLYYKRGQIVHAGREIENEDVLQSFMFGRVAFRKTLINARLPFNDI